jgi:hypothetical protein
MFGYPASELERFQLPCGGFLLPILRLLSRQKHDLAYPAFMLVEVLGRQLNHGVSDLKSDAAVYLARTECFFDGTADVSSHGHSRSAAFSCPMAMEEDEFLRTDQKFIDAEFERLRFHGGCFAMY